MAGTFSLLLAFSLSRRAASDTYPYGWRRAEDLAGLLIVLAIAVSAGLAGWDSIRALAGERHEITAVPLAFAAAVAGIVGNEAVARYKIRVGREIDSASLVADGQHARTDGLASAAAAAGIAGAALGLPVADPIAGLVITAGIVWILFDVGRDVLRRNMDAVEPGLVPRIRTAAGQVDGILGVHDVRARYLGRTLAVQLHADADAALTLGGRTPSPRRCATGSCTRSPGSPPSTSISTRRATTPPTQRPPTTSPATTRPWSPRSPPAGRANPTSMADTADAAAAAAMIDVIDMMDMADPAGVTGTPPAGPAEPTRRSGKTVRAPLITARLHEAYDGGVVELDWTTPFELLIATILSAQSTDKKVNEVTKTLFAKYRGPADYLAVDEAELQRDLYPTGFYRQKTRSVRGVCQALLDRYGGEVPLRMADLITLPGVARKSANVVLGAAAPDANRADPDAGIAVDTHVKRLSRRFAFTRHDDPVKIERDLMRLLPRHQWPTASLTIILHGRRVCDALRPRCGDCVVEQLCPSSQLVGRRDLAGQARGLG